MVGKYQLFNSWTGMKIHNASGRVQADKKTPGVASGPGVTIGVGGDSDQSRPTL
jgi:hypothetical protein